MIKFDFSFFFFRERTSFAVEMNEVLSVVGTSTGGKGVHGPGRESLRR
jgi:hypothetical protein